MNWVDLILLAVLGIFGLRGFFRGLFREILSLAGLIVGFLVAARYGDVAAQYAAQHWKFAPIMLKGAGFIAIFFVIYFGFSVAAWLLHRSEKMLFLKSVNRVGGIAIGIGKGAAVAALAIFLFSSSSLLSPPTRDSLASAYLVPPLSQLGETLIKAGKERIFTGTGAAPTPARGRQAI
ncbi:MAG: CvpA family protein [Candidatus Binatia bacterium]